MGFFESILAFLVAVCMVFTSFMDYGTPESTKEVELIKEEKMVLDAAMYAGQGITTDGEYYYTSGSLTAFGVAGLAKWDADTFEQVAVKYFNWRKQQKYNLDMNADAENGIHAI